MTNVEKQKAAATATAYEYYTDPEADYSSDTAETTAGSDLSHAAVVPGQANLERIWAWNATVPAKISKPVHAIFKETASRQPTASAIDAWDGDFTYEQLDAVTDRVAKHLVALGVTQETIVPLCFEKSKWTPIATLAVMKAGGACVGMDVSQPEERLRSIVSQLNAQLILSSESTLALAGKLGNSTTQTISIDEETLSTLFADPLPHVDLPEVNPNALLYLVFTSGSTGTPKGVMVTHANFSSAIEHQQAAHHFHPQSRVYDFASYAFDVSWSNVLHTLTIGGVLCIPSEEERKNDLAASLQRYHVTYLDITPSLARLLPDSAFKRLETVTLGGEALPAQHAQVWASMVDNLNNPYGPSECTPTATITRISPDELFKGSIGHGLGLNTWVVDPISGDSLMPIGHTGELWLEGPLVGAGYFGDKEKTEKAFIVDPEWLTEGCELEHAGRTGRLFKTGDLVRYNADGSLTFVGRKDAQVKINGQRVELGEIEHQISLALPQNAVADVVAEMVERSTGKKLLVAFLEFKAFASDDDDEFLEFARKTTAGLSEKLRDRLPAYMVPSSHVPLREFPMTGTGKTDRRTLRQMAEAMSLQDLSRLNASSDDPSEVREPSSEVEVLLHALWAAVLAIDEDSFGLDDNFLHLGGDSIVAMKLVAAARDFGISTTVADIFGHPVLADLANVVRLVGGDDARDECPPFSLLQRTDAEAVKLEVAKMLDISPGLIEDVFPCTPLQQGLLSMTALGEGNGGDYVVSYPLQLHDNIDLGRLTVAWDKVLANNAILRTRIVDLQGQGLVQVVVDDGPELTMTTGTAETISRDVKMGLGSPLAHFKLVKNSADEPVTFLWTMHHAVYDGWSVRLLVDQVYQAYMGMPLGRIAPFQNFIQHIQGVEEDEAKAFWQTEFRDLDAPSFPRLPSAAYTPKQDALHESSIDSIQWPKNGITASTIFRAALALLLSEYSASDDVLFGVTMSGRQAAVPGVDQMSGPTITTIPVRVSLEEKRSKSLQDLLSSVQQRAIAATDYEQLGLQNIKKLGAAADRATQFQTLLVVQPKDEDETLEESIFNGAGETMDVTDKESFAELSSNALVIECHFTAQDVKMQLSFDSRVISKVQIERFASQFAHIVKQLCQEDDEHRLVTDVETKSALDLDLIWGWNATVPETHNVCVHDIFSQTAAEHGDKLAIDAWDGKLTYAELDSLSTALARQLLGYSVAGTVVPLCFRKSKWTPVAVWAVMKAGGASVTLDTSQPVDRLKTIVAQVAPVVVLSSAATRDLASSLTSVPVRSIDDGSLSSAHDGNASAVMPLPKVDPSSRLYIVFTSGSTGTPKGVTITHANFASAILHQQAAHKFKPTSRVYDFASYAFDVSWSNMLHTSTIGACLCIPSEEDRKDDLAGSIVSFQSTHADLTPSAAAILPESVMRGLDTIVLGGEKVPEAAIEWSRVVDVINPYGPSECTPTATLTQIMPDQPFTGSIGKGLGLNTWIVSTTRDALVPVGAVGELWLEGPLVGSGYVGDAVKTAAAFVQDPSWLVGGENGRQGRLYRTGDLVRYGDDGELIFLGRKDAQVKINGQRVELSEIESHIQRHELIRQVACIIPKEGPCAGRLTAVVSFHDTSSAQAFAMLERSETITQRIDDVEAAVEATLPAYMIPSVWIPATTLPLSVSGKLNHRELLERVASADKSVVSRGAEADADAPARDARNEMEAMLRLVCSSILNVPENQVNLEASFIANGGDSISAMRLASQCRAVSGITVSVGPLLKSKSLAAFAATLRAADAEAKKQDEVVVDVPFALSPIQQWYFEQVAAVKAEDKKNAYCNQGCYLKLNQAVALDKLADALAAVAEAHPMLRAKFQQTSSQGWTQTILKFDRKSVQIQKQSLASLEDVSRLATERHQSLDAEAGLVFTADICTLANNQTYLVMVAHHLVIDLVSWRIISDDIEASLQGASLQSSLSFQSWTKAQAAHASSLEASKILSTANTGSDLSYWSFTADIPNAVIDQEKTHVEASAETTALVLGNANVHLNTEPVDLLISAVWHAFFQIFSDRENLTIFSEGHGREAWSDDIDLAKTVGWFTTISPIAISKSSPPSSSSAVAHLIRQVKDARRFLPSNGFSYFSSRYLSQDGQAAFANDTAAVAMEMVFNYHGQFQQFEQADAVFLPADLGIAEVGPQLPASSLFGIEVSIEGGITKFEISANKHIAHQDRIAKWAQQIPSSLASICAALTTQDTTASPARTLHDHEFLSLTYDTLDTLESEVLPALERINTASVLAVLPPNPTVDGILLSQLKEPESYKTVQFYEVSGQDIDMTKLAQAWEVVVAKQPALRTVFTPSLDTKTAFYQVILDAHSPNVQQIKASSAEDAIQQIKALPIVSYANVPPHRVALCQVSAEKVIICIEMSHAITDGASNGIIAQSWIDAYAGDGLGSVNLLDTMTGFAAHMQANPAEQKLQYWTTKLADAKPSYFPELNSSASTKAYSVVEGKVDGVALAKIQNACAKLSITPASVVQSAWALTLASYLGADSATFGYLASGRDLDIPGLDECIGAYTNMLVCHTEVDYTKPGSTLASSMYDQILEDLKYQHSSLAAVQHALGFSGSSKGLFNTIISFQKQEAEISSPSLAFKTLDGDDPTEYDVVVNVGYSSDSIELLIDYSTLCLSKTQAERMSSLFCSFMSSMLSDEPLSAQKSASNADLSQITKWNEVPFAKMSVPVHQLIRERTLLQPEAIAIDAWDGQWTYAELDAVSTKLARHLVSVGASSTIVPAVFDKSKWTPVAMLAVMKAGAATVLVDANQPVERLRAIVQQIDPVVILSSAANAAAASGLGIANVLSVSETTMNSLDTTDSDETILPAVNPSSPIYLVFTSGSTGVPKGVVVTHSNIASAIQYQRATLTLDSTSRIYDYSSYMFDVVWCNLLQGLTAGSCICIPRDEDRKTNLVGSITAFNADTVIMTPSAVRGLDIKSLTSLKNLHFIGEALRSETFQDLPASVTVTNLYGPTECTTYSTAQRVASDVSGSVSIGLGSGTTPWIVHPGHGQTLLPVGAVGELCIEGPLVAAGYLGDAEKTKAVFDENPRWLPRDGRVYKTGDLVSYNADGSLTFVGRKDAQVKINGQRVELGEIEHHVQEMLSDETHAFQIIADVITPEGGAPILAAFVALDGSNLNEEDLKTLVADKSAKVDGLLASRLPPHMVPAAYIAIVEIPKTPSGKTDRKVLRAMGKSLSLESLSKSSERRQPSTAAEHVLQGLWAAVLNVPADNISVDDSFLRIGGDSVSAMKLVGKAREANMTLTVADVFSSPRLEDMAAKMQAPEGSLVEAIAPFALLHASTSKEDAIEAAASQCSTQPANVQDVYPCTPLQEGMMALTLKRPGDYVLRCVFELKTGIDVAALRRSWNELVRLTPTLRTRIVDMQGKLAQVVLDEAAHWQQDGSVSDVSQVHRPEQPVVMELGTPLLYAQMVTIKNNLTQDQNNAQSQTQDNTQLLVITIHHALYDGWSLGLVFDELEKIHLGSELSSSSSSADFRRLVQHATGVDKAEAKTFWANHFAGSESASFPSLPSPMYEPVPRSISTHAVSNISWPSRGITPSTLVRAAMTILVSKYTDTRDVTFGITSSGRQAPIAGIERMVGPAIATVPFRSACDADDSLDSFLSKMQASAIEMTKYEQTGLQHIRKMSPDADKACQFQMLVIVQPADEAGDWNSSIIERDVVPDEPQELDTYALTLECQLSPDGVKIKTTFDANVMSEMQVTRFQHQLEHTLRQLCSTTPRSNITTTVGDVSATSEHDLRDMWTWNEVVPEAVDAAVHDLIHQRALQQPDAPAICAWNGDFTYKQLDDLSTQLACKLMDAGITANSTIPLFFEKSKWTPIAMVAVMKAGASAVAVDCGQPDDRLLSIIGQVEAPLILCSQSKQAIAQRLVSLDTIVVDESAFSSQPEDSAMTSRSLPAVDPSSKLYIVFTSGSTGTPKGVVITHRNMASAIKHQKVIQCMHSQSRVFDFASYAFDVAWANTMCSFEVGACLCIPSDADRKDDLSGAVLRLRATHADVTPSAALVLSKEALLQLDTLTLGGERLTMDNASKWAEHTIVKNSYGPSECTPTATFSKAICCGDDFNGTIGTGSGLNTWIVDAETGSSLVPIGAIGELWLEGPLVGNGYLNDPVKTDGVFIKNPKWLQAGFSSSVSAAASPPSSASTASVGSAASVTGRAGRLYKTGDLVRYNPDGSIDFIGRKDAQVKINGQRVELTEIETHITANASVFQAACFWVTSGPCARRLVTVLSLAHLRRGDIIAGTSISLPSPEEAALFDDSIEAIKAKLKIAVPSYMVPAIWIPLFDLPQTASGKMNGKALKDWLVTMDDATFQRIKSDAQTGSARAAETQTETILAQACSGILNIPEDQVNLEASFIANGGDSITAMQVASACRAKGVTVSVALLLRAKTLAEFAASSGALAQQVVSYKEEYDALFALSPIQQWYFGLEHLELGKHGQQYNQGFYLKMTKTAAPAKVKTALDKVVAANSMLRARFQLVDGVWMQKVLPPATTMEDASLQYHFEQSQVPDLAAVETLASARQSSIDIVNGPVFSSDLCLLPSGEQYLILVAHHAVIDLVSWRIIMDDLETLLTTNNDLIASMPFQLWAKAQQDMAEKSTLATDKLLSTSGADADLSFWQFAPGLTPNTRGDHHTLSVRADACTTRLLLGDANSALSTEPVELLLSAVWHSFLTSFPERRGLTVFNEAHGREPWNDAIDIAKTVGWFTTMSPIHVDRDRPKQAAGEEKNIEIAQLVRQVKDARRRMPGNGLPYFASRYLTDAGKAAFAGHDVMEVLFNYHGQFHQLERDDAFFQDVTFESVVEQGPGMPESSLFNLEVSIDDSEVEFSISYNKHVAHQDRIQTWAAQIASALETICRDLSTQAKTKTLVDYSFLHLDYAGLDKLHQDTLPAIASANNGSAVDDIFPCKPTVDGILLSQIKDAEAYKTVQIYEVTHANSVDVARLSSAWAQVVAKQPALRTVFVPGLDDQAAFSQAILSSHSPDIVTLSADDEESAMKKMESLEPTNYQQLTPPHRIVLCQISASTVLCQIEMSHAITDGFSSSVVVEEWMAAYDSTLKSTDLLETTRQFNRLSSDKPSAERLSFWSDKLAGIEPCVFPRLAETNHKDICNEVLNIEGSELADFTSRCTALSVTPSSVVMAAWALTLSAYTGLDSVAFGYLASGRDLPVLGLDECVGAFANMMILKADNLRQQDSKSDYVQGIHGQVMKDLSYQHCSLASIQHELGLGPDQVLFNSIISFQRAGDESEEDANSLTFKNIDGLDPTEYDVVLGVSSSAKLLEIELDYSTLHLTDSQALSVLALLKSMILRLVSPDEASLKHAAFLSAADSSTIWQWNSTVPEPIHRCVHDMISETVQRQPDDIAICAWDGDWTYQELEDKSTLLAHYLLDHGVTAGSIIPVCLEKSRWTPIATLAAMKTGACTVTLDHSQPAERLRTIVEQVDANVILTSTTNKALANDITPEGTLIVTTNEITFPIPRTARPLPAVDPANKLYLNFTSGTTGTPKGVIVTHANYASAIVYQQAAHLFKPHSRVFDFASYAFDVSWSNLLHTLTIGAVLCIPSDQDRKDDLAGSIARLEATHADLTPSAASTLPLETFAQLETVVLGGEKLSPELARSWSALVDLINPYGPSECTPTATLVKVDPNEPFGGSIGRGIGMNTWIVDPITSESLVPIGTVGELLLEGPLVGDGYLNNPEKTAAAFVENPAWLSRGSAGQDGRSGRLYCTGDLVKYAPDGSIIFIGRKDTQVKINGQRVEMGDIEHHVQTALDPSHSEGMQVVVELVQPQHVAKKVLLAFISTTTSLGGANITVDDEVGKQVTQATAGIRERLGQVIPAYMIPAAFIPLSALPIATTGKTDRKRLQALGASLTPDQLSDDSSSSEYIEPTTTNERILRSLWAKALIGVKEDRISANDSFLKVGGDSIGAMRLATAARSSGHLLSVADILRNPKLSDMAKFLQSLDGNEVAVKEYEPFSLLPESMSQQDILSSAARFDIDQDSIMDIMPITDQQSRLISMTYTEARTLLIYHTLDGTDAPDVQRMRLACRNLVERYDMLRTVFFAHGSAFYQAVLSTVDLGVEFYTTHSSLDECTETIRLQDTKTPLRYGARLTAFSVIHDTKANAWRIVVRVSHAQHDGLSMAKLWSAFEGIYNNNTNNQAQPIDTLRGPGSFSNFMHGLSQTNKAAARSYWKSLLGGSSMTTLKPRSQLTVSYGEGPFFAKEIRKNQLSTSEFTFSTLLRAAWAYVLAQHTKSTDVVFSSLTHGRNVDGAQDVFGACVNVVPSRVQLQQGWTARKLLAAVKAQGLASMDHEHLGSREIVRECTSWPKWTYAGSVVYYHNLDDGEEKMERSMHEEGEGEGEGDLVPDVDNTDVHITAKPAGDSFRIEFGFAVDVLSHADAEALATLLMETIVSFNNNMDEQLALPTTQPQIATPAEIELPEATPYTDDMMAVVDHAWLSVFPDAATNKQQQTLFDLGGDISSASLLCAHIQRQGHAVSVEQVLGNPTRAGLAGILTSHQQQRASFKTKVRTCFPISLILQKFGFI